MTRGVPIRLHKAVLHLKLIVVKILGPNTCLQNISCFLTEEDGCIIYAFMFIYTCLSPDQSASRGDVGQQWL